MVAPWKGFRKDNHDPRLVVHELGHVFNQRANSAMGRFQTDYGGGYNTPYSALDAAYNGTDPGYTNFPRRDDRDDGFYDEPYGWQQSTSSLTGEEFADMFVGWTYNTWGDNSAGATRSNWMNEPDHMFFWTVLVVGWY